MTDEGSVSMTARIDTWMLMTCMSCDAMSSALTHDDIEKSNDTVRIAPHRFVKLLGNDDAIKQARSSAA
ncbi:hypothetical protein, partial [Burkholderia pseudomallei]|uniref:hypothetical protein n=1 Tax=Burkholderia pseudomallei TaxID=28450 RepID=UPI001CA5EDFB